MNFNLSSILQNGIKILNIVNRTLPLVKEFNPALGVIRKKLKNVSLPVAPVSNNNVRPVQNRPTPVRINNRPNGNNNNTLTFFR